MPEARQDPRELERAAEKAKPEHVVDTDSPKAAGKDIFGLLKAMFKNIGKDGLTRQAAATAYHFLFSFVPLVIFTTATASTVARLVYDGTDEAVTEIMDWVFRQLPAEAARAVEEPLTNAISESSGGLLSFGAIFAIIGARNAIGSMMQALNAAYRVEEDRPFWKRQLLAIGLTIATGFGIIIASTLFLFGEQIGNLISGPLGLGDAWALVWSIGRWPLIIGLMLLAISVLYWAGPNVELPFRWLTPGAAVAVVLFGVVTIGLSYYFQYFGGYAQSYGVLGGVMAFVFWLYAMSLVILIGGELNATVARRAAERTGETSSDSDSDETDAATVERQNRERELDRRVAAALTTPQRSPRPVTGPLDRQRTSTATRALGASAAAAVVGAIAAWRR